MPSVCQCTDFELHVVYTEKKNSFKKKKEKKMYNVVLCSSFQGNGLRYWGEGGELEKFERAEGRNYYQ